MPKQELDLFQIATGLAAELRAGTAGVMAPKFSIPISLADWVTTGLADHASLGAGSQQGSRLIKAEACQASIPFHPNRNSDGTDASALAAEIGDDPAILSHL